MTQRERDKLFERCCEDLYKATPKRDYFIKGINLFFNSLSVQIRMVLMYKVGIALTFE